MALPMRTRCAEDAPHTPSPRLAESHPSPARTVFVRGVLFVGLPVALLLDLALLALANEAARYASVEHALQLAVLVPAVALAVGALVGNRLARRHWPATDDVEATADDGAHEDDPDGEALSAFARRIESLPSSDARRLLREATRLALLGYGYAVSVGIGMMALGFVLRAVGGWWGGVGFWVCFPLGVMVLSVLLIRWQAPSGLPLAPRQGARLRALIAEAARHVDAPAPHEVSISLDFNAFAAVVPRFGLFGAGRRVVTLGLPLLAAMREDELRALLAHELAHHGRGHLRRVLWITRVRAAWTALGAFVESTPHWARFLLAAFARWYVPRLELCADALARGDEHEADGAAASVGTDAAARLLLRMAIWQRFLVEEVYPAVRRGSAERPHPDADSLDRLLGAMRKGPSEAQAIRWLRGALADTTLEENTHPSLADRLRAIGVPAPTDDVGAHAAVRGLLEPGPRAIDLLEGGGLVRKLGSEWEHALALAWRAWSADAETWRAAAGLPESEWSEDAVRARARWSAQCLPPAEAEPEVRRLLARVPDDLEGTALLGGLLVDMDGREPEGQALLETVSRTDSRAALEAAALLLAYYGRVGAADPAARVRRRQRVLERRVLRGSAERLSLRADDRLHAHPATPATREMIRRACAPRADIERAWLVRKRTRSLRDQPLVVLAVQGRRGFRDDSSAAQRASAELVTRVALPERADLLVAVVPPRGALARRLAGMREALVFERR